jgi:hypothetical protein
MELDVLGRVAKSAGRLRWQGDLGDEAVALVLGDDPTPAGGILQNLSDYYRHPDTGICRRLTPAFSCECSISASAASIQ